MNIEHAELIEKVGEIPLFRGLNAEVVARVAAATCQKTMPAKEHIYWQGDVPRSFYYVLSGHVRRAIVSAEGDEKLIDVVAAGGQFGLTELVGGAERVSAAEAVEATTLLEIGANGLIPAMESSRDLSRRVLSAVAESYMALEQEVAATFFHSGCRRLLDYLLNIAGPNLKPVGDTVVVLPISKGLLAERLGVTAETVSRAFRDLSAAGLVSVRGKTITLLAKLAQRRAAAGEGAAEAAIAEHQEEVRGRRRADAWARQTSRDVPLGSRAWI